jgi:hypothetical protein
MKKVLIFALALVMLLACVACSNTPDNNGSTPNKNDNSSLLAGSKHPLTSETPMEKRPPVSQVGGMNASEKKPFDKNDPRKKYLEEKYGVTAYLVSEKQPGSIYSIFALEGYEGTFQLFAKEDLIATGASEESITTDYTDNAYFTVAYVEIYEYFARAIEASGITVDRMIIKQRIGNVNPYDPNKSFTECLASAPNGAKRFEIRLYGDFDNGDDVCTKLFMEIQKLDFIGTVSFYNVLKDISNLTNDDLMDYKTSKDYVVSSYPMQQVK